MTSAWTDRRIREVVVRPASGLAFASGCGRARKAGMIPDRGDWQPGPPERGEARRAPGETPGEPWHTSSVTSSPRSVSEA